MRQFTRRQFQAITALTVAGFLIRVLYLYDRAPIGDEIGTLIYIQKDIPYLLSHFDTWLTMNYYLVAEKIVVSLFGTGSFSLGLLSLLPGVAVIPLSAVYARRLAPPAVACAVAALVAFNPFLIQYSGIARAYSLLVMMTLVTMITFQQWEAHPSTYGAALFAFVSCLSILVHPNGVYPVLSSVSIGLLGFLRSTDRNRQLPQLRALFTFLAVAGIVTMLAYFRIAPDMVRFGLKWHGSPPGSISYLPYVIGMQTAGGLWGWPWAFFLFSGMSWSIITNQKLFYYACAVVALPVVLLSLRGFDCFPWAHGRFFIFIVPTLMLIMAYGICRFTMDRGEKWFAGAVVLLMLTWVPALGIIFHEKNDYPWHRVTAYVKEQLGERVLIVANDPSVSLQFTPSVTGVTSPVLTVEDMVERIRSGTFPPYERVCLVSFEYRTPRVTAPIFPSCVNVRSDAPTTWFGKIQLVEYADRPNLPFWKQLERDLKERVRGVREPAPELAPIYRNLMALSRLTDGGKSAPHYEKLWSLCHYMTDRERYMPLSLHVWRSRQFFVE